ncbi:MAG: N-6 DNA methylase [Candidatus Peribacteraceae bacterium]|nr:N-6 DNA methylase [Candidatus Peribacteraceae bacterium]
MLPVDLVIIFTMLLIIGMMVTSVYGFIAGVPYVPTPHPVARAMVDLARLRGTENVMDIGAGNGRVLIEAKRKHPSIDATGIELAPTVWLLGKLNIFLSGIRIRFIRGNAFDHDMSRTDVIFLYLSPAVMAKLEDKFDRELKPGTVVISHAFTFPRRQPVEMTALPGWMGKKTIRRYEW